MQASSQIIPPSAAPRSEATQNGAAAQASRPGHGELSIGGSTSAEQAVQFAQLADRREDAELEQAALKQRQQLPKNIKGFRQHPLYVLKRHIGKYQGLKPGTAPLSLSQERSACCARRRLSLPACSVHGGSTLGARFLDVVACFFPTPRACRGPVSSRSSMRAAGAAAGERCTGVCAAVPIVL